MPRVEVRLRVPVAQARSAGDGARERLVAETLLSGTGTRSAEAVAEDLQRLGATLHAGVDADALTLTGSTLAPTLGPFLELVAEVLTGASFPAADVELQRARQVQEITILRSQPGVIAEEALALRLYGRHPYGRGLPVAEAVRRVGRASLRRFLTGRVLPAGSVAVLVGDLRPSRALDAVEAAFDPWQGDAGGGQLAPPAPPRPGPVVVVDRPGAVQTNIRLGGPSLPRDAPGYPALAVANVAFGGYTASRLFGNIRERRGYTYSPRSSIQHHRVASRLTVAADVATEVTVPALVEIRYELVRMASATLSQAELDGARRYLPGSLALTVQTQRGLASYLATVLAGGLDVGFLAEFPRQVGRVGLDDVLEAGRGWLAPRRFVTVLVGDAERVAGALEAVDDVEVRAGA